MESAKLGMWLFLATEIMLFAGLFCAYAIYRAQHPEVFIYASQFLDRTLGGFNTVVLICSSLTMAWAVRAAQLNQRALLCLLLALTILGGITFMGVKYVEYQHKWKHGLLWATQYSHTEEGEHGEDAEGHSEGDLLEAIPETELEHVPIAFIETDKSTGEDVSNGETFEFTEEITPTETEPLSGVPGKDAWDMTANLTYIEATVVDHPRNVGLFFSIYFLLTGLHGIHVIIGIGFIFWILFRAYKGDFHSKYFYPVDSVGLYWHLVDLIWIFLFPLLYLID